MTKPPYYVEQAIKLLTADPCRTLLPWFKFRHGTEPMDEFHRCYFELYGPEQWWATPLMMVSWPVVSCIRAVSHLRAHGRLIEQKYEVPRWAQFWQLVFLANRFNISTRSYLFYRLWQPSNRARVGLYVQRHEQVRVPRWVAGGADRIVHHKYSFFMACVERGVPTIPVLVQVGQDGGRIWHCPDSALPRTDLYIKPTSAHVGLGVERWRHDAAVDRWRRQDAVLDAHGVMAHVARKAADMKKSMIVQSMIGNHPDLERFGKGQLVCLRVLTGRSPDTAPGFILSYLSMPTGDAETGHIDFGGVFAGVSDNGILIAGYSGNDYQKAIRRHPDTGSRIEGEVLPYWREMVDTALFAHERFPEAFSVGWDVAMTPKGPVIIEGNSPCGLETIQAVNYKPVGETTYPNFFNAALAEKHTADGKLK